MSPLRHAVAASLTTLALGATVSGRKLAAVPRPARPGRLGRGGAAVDLEPGDQRRVEDRHCRARPLVANRLGQPRLSDDGDRRRAAAGRQGPGPHAPGGPQQAGRGVRAPRLAGRRQEAHLQGDRAGARHRRGALGEGGLRRAGLRRPAQAGQLRLADAGHRRHPGLRLLRLRGRLRLRLRRQAAVEGRHRRHQDARHGHGELAGALQEPGHPAVRRGQRRRRRSSPRSTPRPARRCGRRSGRPR